MDKNEILNKSREENANADLYGNEVREFGFLVGSLVALIVTMIIFFVEWSVKGVKNYGLYAILASAFAAKSIVQAVKLREKTYIVAAIVYTVITIATFIAYVLYLV